MSTGEFYKVPGRAYTSKQKAEIIGRIHVLWEAYPELRLGQLLINILRGNFYYMEDFDLINNLEQGYRKNKGDE